MLHCHSNVGVLLERFCAMRYEATHPVEPPPMGDVTPEDFKARVGGRLAMIGNLQIGEMLAGDPQQIRGWVRDLIEVMGLDGGLVLCDSATPWETPMKDETPRNCFALIEAAHEFGRGA
jgi:uroporphyrinogen-III decarboxylase